MSLFCLLNVFLGGGMSALIGFTKRNPDTESARTIIADMSQLILQCSKTRSCIDRIFVGKKIAATRIHQGVLQRLAQPSVLEGVYVWLDGELYNRQELSTAYKVSPQTDLELFALLYLRERGFNFLSKIDGIFSVVLYDSNINTLHFISDRYGLKPLAWMKSDQSIYWASEIKAFLAVPNFKPKIDKDSVDGFFADGHLAKQLTWFAGVSVLPSGTVLSFDLFSMKKTSTRYWWWEDLIIDERRTQLDDMVHEFGYLFRRAVSRRIKEHENVGLLLSGGLDSRAILAAIPADYGPVNAVTFGLEGSLDVKYAVEATMIKGARHHVFSLSESNWLDHRVETVWRTDGQLNFLHMHGIEHAHLIGQLFDINLHGFLGDAILGGSYLTNNRRSIASKIDNRGRRFIALGPLAANRFYKSRFPFFDNQLMEFTLSIPSALRKNSYIYNKMLLEAFPDYYTSIPWAKTKTTIDRPDWYQLLSRFVSVVNQKVSSKIMSRVDGRDFTNYPLWMRRQPGKDFFEKILFDKNRIYPEYISPDEVRNCWVKHMAGSDFSVQLCLTLTFEIWLQQVFREKFRFGLGDASHFSCSNEAVIKSC